jgi:hypothetical protein
MVNSYLYPILKIDKILNKINQLFILMCYFLFRSNIYSYFINTNGGYYESFNHTINGSWNYPCARATS